MSHSVTHTTLLRTERCSFRNKDGRIKCLAGALMMVHLLYFEIFWPTKFYEVAKSKNDHLLGAWSSSLSSRIIKTSSNTGNVKRFPYIFVVCLNKPPFLETDIIVLVYLDLSGTVNHSWQASVWFAKEGVTPVINHVFPFTDQLCVYPQISSQTTKTTIRF